MRVRQLSPTFDMTFGSSGLNFLVDSPAAVGQVVQTSLLLWLGEWFLDTTLGMPWIESVFGKHSQDTADLSVQNYILDVQGVVDIQNYVSVNNQSTRKYLATCTINTIFGQTQQQIANESLF